MQPVFFYRIAAVIIIAAGVVMLVIFGPLLAMLGAYLVAGGAGAAIGDLISRAPELRSMRLAQLVLLPLGFVLCVYVSSFGGLGGFTFFLGVLGFLIMLIAPNIAYLCGAGLASFLDPQDWTPSEEEIALRPIRLLIDRDNYRQALGELDELFKTHKPTYEAVLLKARLLHHIGRTDEARSTLAGLIALSNSTPQQLAVMEMLTFLDENPQPPKPPASGARRIEMSHELVLFQTSGDDPPARKEIPPGLYQVEEIIHRDRLWLKLAGEDWGNAAMCWEAIQAIDRPASAPPKKGLLWRIARMNQALTLAIKGKPRRQLLAESRDFFQEAKDFIRRDDWHSARPLLQKASACDPDRFEIAYRWVMAVRQTADDAETAQVVSQVLGQSQWSQSEEDMLKQLRRPIVN